MIRTPCVSALVFFLHAILPHNFADAKNLAVGAGPTPSALTAKALIMQAMKGHYGESCVDVTSKTASSAKVALDVVSSAASVTLNCSETTSALTLTTERKTKRSSAFICSETVSGVSTNLSFAASDADPTSQFISLARNGSGDGIGSTSTGLYCNASKDFEKLLEVQVIKALGPIIQQANLPYQCASLSAGSAKPSSTTYSFDGKNLSLFGKTYSIEKDLSSEKFTAGANANSLSLALTTGDTIQLDLSRDGKSLAMIRLLSGALMTTCLPKKSP